MEQIVRAIDVGYGNTKFVKQHVYGQDIECDLYPSFAPLRCMPMFGGFS